MFIIILYKFNQNKLYTFRYISFIIDYFKLTVIICNKIYYIILCQYKVTTNILNIILTNSILNLQFHRRFYTYFEIPTKYIKYKNI